MISRSRSSPGRRKRSVKRTFSGATSEHPKSAITLLRGRSERLDGGGTFGRAGGPGRPIGVAVGGVGLGSGQTHPARREPVVQITKRVIAIGVACAATVA